MRIEDAEKNVLLTWANPLDAIEWLDGQRRVGRRWVGYFGYELGPWLEAAVPRAGKSRWPWPIFIWTEHEFSEEERDIAETRTPEPHGRWVGSNFTREGYVAAIGRAIDYIAAGDIFQVNLAQQLRIAYEGEPEWIHRKLERAFPAWYAALLSYEDFAIVSNSPELFLRTWREGGVTRIETRPIKGTRPRQNGMDVELRESQKDQAELNMIVDLERNDLGRVCEFGTVKVSRGPEIETHPTVYHGSATVQGTLRKDVKLLDILHATFPGGSITGAPKIRAMQIIAELEGEARGPYCGAIGYLDADGAMQLNVAIRTMTIRNGEVLVPVGGGIVADSDPQMEYDETLIKARAAMSALGITKE